MELSGGVDGIEIRRRVDTDQNLLQFVLGPVAVDKIQADVDAPVKPHALANCPSVLSRPPLASTWTSRGQP